MTDIFGYFMVTKDILRLQKIYLGYFKIIKYMSRSFNAMKNISGLFQGYDGYI